MVECTLYVRPKFHLSTGNSNIDNVETKLKQSFKKY